MKHYVVMGVSGCGKSSVGAAVAAQINAQFVDADDLHPRSNIEKMARGEPLNDTDRHPWLIAVGRQMVGATTPMIVGCSALRRVYRDIIRQEAHAPVCFLHLKGSRAVLETRMQSRPGHFMPPSLLDSQLETLEPPQADEDAIEIDIDQPFDHLVAASVARMSETRK